MSEQNTKIEHKIWAIGLIVVVKMDREHQDAQMKVAGHQVSIAITWRDADARQKCVVESLFCCTESVLTLQAIIEE